MNRKWYRKNAVKSILCITAVLTFTAAACGGVCSLMLADRIQYVQGENTECYARSFSFAREAQGDFFAIMSAVQGQEMLQEKTKTGDDRVIDLQAVLDGTWPDEDNNAASGLAYRVADLKKWAMADWNGAGSSEAEKVIVCRRPDGGYDYYYYDDFARRFTDGRFVFIAPDIAGEGDSYLDNYTLSVLEMFRMETNPAVPEEIKAIADERGDIRYVDFWNYGSIELEEKYLPVGETGLLDVVNEKQEWNGRLNEALSALTRVLESLRTAQYEEQLLEQFREGNTNLTYLYADLQSRTVYTNAAEYQNYRGYTKALEQMTGDGKSYVLLKPTLSECGTTMNIDLQEWQGYISEVLGLEDFICALSVDETFPVADAYAQSAQMYEKYAKWILPLAAATGLLILLFLICLAVLTAAAGRREKDDGLYLNFFDRLYTEISVGCILAGWLLAMAAESYFLVEVMDAGDLLVIACGAFLTSLGFLGAYFNIVKKIKARILWKNSLLRLAVNRCRKFLNLYAHNVPDKAKIVLTVGACALLALAVGNLDILLPVFCIAALFFGFQKANGQEAILEGLKKISGGEVQYKIDLEKLSGTQKTIADYVNRVGDGLDVAVENSLKNERMKTELITNVSHDIKTPLTSIINYVDLLKREEFTEPRIQEYIQILEKKAQRLKTLTEDVVEAAKASTGNVALEMAELDFRELGKQMAGEFEERFAQSGLAMVTVFPEHAVLIRADGRRLWRVLENVFQNAVKYAMRGTRVYIELAEDQGTAVFSVKNVSSQPLNFSADELTERFIRGDVARNTEGSGLGLSIAKDLTALQGGAFRVYVDGDLFRVDIGFPEK